MTGLPPALLLDTCAAIDIMNKRPMTESALAALAAASQREGLFVSPVVAWEVGLLARPTRRPPLAFLPDARTWMLRLMAGPSIRLAPLGIAIAVESSLLPGTLHDDPADRLLIATSRAMAMPLVTRDRLILTYAEAGHIQVIPC